MRTDMEHSWRQSSSLKYGQTVPDAVKPPSGKPSASTGTVIALLAQTTTVNAERPRPELDRENVQHRRTLGSAKAVQPDGLSTQVSNKFTDNFQHGIILTFPKYFCFIFYEIIVKI